MSGFPADPYSPAPTSRPIWRPQLFPAVVIIEPAPEGFGGCPFLDPHAPPFVGQTAADGFHATVRDDDGDHYVWLPRGCRAINVSMSIPRDGYYCEREQCARRFCRWLEGKPSGRVPCWLRFSRYQIHRLSLMLRAWDGAQAGVSRQEIASVLLNADLRKLRSIDWKNTSERRRIGRLLAVAQELIDGDYLRLLCPMPKLPDRPRRR